VVFLFECTRQKFDFSGEVIKLKPTMMNLPHLKSPDTRRGRVSGMAFWRQMVYRHHGGEGAESS
jgi:hypothetical protein